MQCASEVFLFLDYAIDNDVPLYAVNNSDASWGKHSRSQARIKSYTRSVRDLQYDLQCDLQRCVEEDSDISFHSLIRKRSSQFHERLVNSAGTWIRPKHHWRFIFCRARVFLLKRFKYLVMLPSKRYCLFKTFILFYFFCRHFFGRSRFVNLWRLFITTML